MTEELRLVTFSVVGLGFSLFYGLNAVAIFQVTSVAKRAWRFHQFWLTFFGSLVGWVAMWFLMARLVAAMEAVDAVKFSLSSVALFFLAFVGVTGFLPLTVVSLINSIRALVGEIAGLPSS